MSVVVRALIACAYAGVAILGAVAGYADLLGPPPDGASMPRSVLVTDRNGALLRPYAAPDGRWRIATRPADVDPRFLEALFAYEDKRFHDHHGVDPLATARAAFQFASSGRIVSGGSTITMQVARLLEPRRERSLSAKLRQAVRALQLEQRLSKNEILSLYLTLAPYGGNLEGARAASLAWFGKEPRRLTLGEIALLVALTQSPEARRPDRDHAAAQIARDRVLDRLVLAGAIDAPEAVRAKAEPVPTYRRPMPVLAPHAADQAIAFDPKASEHGLTIESGLQSALETMIRERVALLGHDISAALVVVDNETGEVLARIASPGYFDIRRAGQVDQSRAIRSPGSALKPFIYGLGFEDGLVHPETLLDDRPLRYGVYAPKNFDMSYQGVVTVRRALQLSLNVPAVMLLDRVGPSRLTARLAQAGAPLVLPKGDAPGLALGLGGVGVKLTDLTMLYAGIARGGQALPLRERLDAPQAAPRRLLDPAAAWQVADALLGAPPPEGAAGGLIAFKTGTSYGYRDAWAVGFDGKRTVGVWVGRPDGAPLPGLLGRVAAAPILFDAFSRVTPRPAPLPPRPAGVLVASSASLPAPLRRFEPDWLVGGRATARPQFMFPPDGAELELSMLPGETEPSPVPLKISGGVQPLTVLMNGVPLDTDGPRRMKFFTPDGPGFVRLTVIDARGEASSVRVRVR